MIGYINSATSAILNFFQECTEVAVPDNLCRSVANQLSTVCNLRLIETNGLGTADYMNEIAHMRPGSGLLFIHSYGILDLAKRDKVWAACEKGSIKFIDDFCLIRPRTYFDKSLRINNPNYLSITSFGYSKVVDLGAGGLAMGSDDFVKNICNEKDHILSVLHTNRRLSSNFISYVSKLDSIRVERSLPLRKVLCDIFNDEVYSDADWRFSVQINKNSKLFLKMKNEFPSGLFWGNNYGKLHNVDGIYQQSFADMDFEIFNFFHDFRVNMQYIIDLGNYIKCG